MTTDDKKQKQPDKDEEAAKEYCDQFSWNDPREEDAYEAFLAGCKHKEDEILTKVRVYFEVNEYMDLKPQRILDIIAGQSVPLPESLALKEKETPPQPEGEE